MAKAKHFAAFGLHPGAIAVNQAIGGAAKIRFGPAPAGAEDFMFGFKINVPQSKILPVLWNPKNWTATLEGTLNYDRDSGGSTLFNSFTGSISGKFVYAYCYTSAFYSPRAIVSTNAEPAGKACGICDRYDSITAINQNDWLYPYTLPNAKLQMIGDDDSSGAVSCSVTDKDGVQSGFFNSSASISSIRSGSPLFTLSGVLEVSIHEIYLKDNGTADVIAYIECALYGGGSVELWRNVPDGYQDLGLRTINFLGVTVPCHLVYDGPSIPPGMNISAFSFSYDVVKTEGWTY